MKKRLFAILLVFCMLATVFAGCAKTESTGTGSTTSGSETTTKQGATSGSTQSSGPKVTAPGELPVTTEKVTLTLGITQNVRCEDYEDNFMTKMVLDDCGIELDFTLFPADQPKQKLQLMINSGEELPDIIHFGFSDAERSAYGRDGFFSAVK